MLNILYFSFILQSMSQRLYGCESLASNARLRQFLSSNGGFLATSDFVSSRMSELKGGSSPPVTPRRTPRKSMAVPSMRNPPSISDTQLMDLEAKNDQLNADLAQVYNSVCKYTHFCLLWTLTVIFLLICKIRIVMFFHRVIITCNV